VNERPNKRMKLTERGLRRGGGYPGAPFLTELRFAAYARCSADSGGGVDRDFC